MPNRLEPINMVDFTGGLNLRSNQFQLAPNESPEMMNIVLDPLGGIHTRFGWQRWNAEDIVDVETEGWDPRRAFLHQLSDGSDVIYVAANNKIYWAREDAVFQGPLPMTADAKPHMADFYSWGDTIYIGCGRSQPMWKREGVGTATALTAGGTATWNDEYTMPERGVFPQAEINEGHAGYMFVANTQEDGIAHPNRLRWSHPSGNVEDWASSDFFDIDAGGSHITGIWSFEDHLLIFKNDSMWALYGYGSDSWQLVQKSSTIGAANPQGITRNEQGIFFFSASDRGGIYAYGGERPQEISEQLRRAFFEIINHDLVWVGWIGRKLFVTLPWKYSGPTVDDAGMFVLDPTVGNGAWTYYSAQAGSVGPIVAHSNVDSQPFPLGVIRGDTACVVQMMRIDDAFDKILQDHVLGTETGAVIVTDQNDEISLIGDFNREPFDTIYRTPWITADWPSRKKSWRRPDFVCRETGFTHQLAVRSYRDYEETQPKRQYSLQVPSTGASARWGEFTWGDGTTWGAGKSGASIRRGSSFGMCRALQLRIAGNTPLHKWGIDAIVLKIVLRRFR